MPVLKSPEVTPFYYNGVTCFQQEVYGPNELDDFETDVGVNDYTDMNVICPRIELRSICPANALENSLRMTIHLCEEWEQKDEMRHTLRVKHGVHIHEERNPYSKGSMMSVNGFKDIETLANALRSFTAVSEHKGASIHRQIVNPALLIAALDAAVVMIRDDNEKRKRVDWRKSYPPSDWNSFNL